MKGIIRHISVAAIALLAVLGCTKNEPTTSGRLITMTAHEAGSTKALLEQTTFMTAGNQIVVYDYYTAPEDAQNPNPATGYYYIPGVTAQSTGATETGTVWPFIDNARYEWTDAGTHKFFGWLQRDNNMTQQNTPESFFGSGFGFNTANHILTIPIKALSQDSPQFDFMYSGITPREPATQGYDQVALGFKHLFTAFKVTVGNSSSNEVKLKSVKITGLKNSQSATINYSNPVEGLPIVTYTAANSTGEFIYNQEAALSLEKDPNSGTAIVHDISGGYKLMWPHTKADFAGAKVIVAYDYKEAGQTSWNTNGYTEIDLANLSGWSAGEKYAVALMFKDKEIVLTCNVEPWTVVEETIDFTNQVSVSSPITWDAKTVQHVNEQAGEVILYSDGSIVATCNFHIDTPQGATWTASLIPIEGSVDAFKIVEDTKYGAVGVDSQIKIIVTNDAPISRRHVVKLRITIQTADGRTIIGNLMPKNTNPSVTEYKLIQNMING